MGKIATEQEAYNIGGIGTPTKEKCCTKTRAEALGCKVSGSYTNNQLVQLQDLSKAYSVYGIGIYISITLDNATFNNDNHYASGTLKISCGDTYYATYTFPTTKWNSLSNNKTMYHENMGGYKIYAPSSGFVEAKFELRITEIAGTSVHVEDNPFIISKLSCSGGQDLRFNGLSASGLVTTSDIELWTPDGACTFNINVTSQSSSSSSTQVADVSLMNISDTENELYVIRPTLVYEQGEIKFNFNMDECPSDTKFGFIIDIIDGQCKEGDLDKKEPTRTYHKIWDIQKDGIKNDLTLSDLNIEQGSATAIRIQPYIENPLGSNCVQFASHLYELYF